jgi:hypothetical protein
MVWMWVCWQTCWCFQLISIQFPLLCLSALPELIATICFKSISTLTVPKFSDILIHKQPI